MSGIGAVYDRDIFDDMQRLVDVCDLETLEDGEYAVCFMKVIVNSGVSAA
jgi:hypothetical protein